MHPAVMNTTVDGEEAYATSDLLMPHPTKPGYWKIYGRVDDQIMHNTGQKVCSAFSIRSHYTHHCDRPTLDRWKRYSTKIRTLTVV